MTQNELNREIAHVTGESVETISGMGFSVVTVPTRRADHRPRLGGIVRRLMHRRRKVHGKHARMPRPKTAPVKLPVLAPAA